MLRKLSVKCNVPKCHPHKFRRTCATVALPYISITDSTVKDSHGKYMG